MTTVLAIAVPVTLLLGLVGLLWMAERLEQQKNERYARQIALTDAIHRELGAVAAPTLRRRRGGGWLVAMTVPLDRPATVTALVRITDQFFASSTTDGYEIVLTQKPGRSDPDASRTRRSPLEKPASVAA